MANPCMISETAAVLGAQAERCRSRSLLNDRFASPDAKKGDRESWFRAVAACKPVGELVQYRKDFLLRLPGVSPSDIVFAKLQARLILNAAVGVMENAGLCLDRFSGAPYVPGSAAKGCARRAAIQALAEAETAIGKAELLIAIAQAFGWASSDWSARPLREDSEIADFRGACGEELWPDVRKCAMAALSQRFPEAGGFPANCAGTVRFLPAFAFEAPNPDLELDIVTSHHGEYYAGGRETATDDEEPVPVVFPAVAAGHVFAFAVLPDCPITPPEVVRQARAWLVRGLTEFGLGAKTAAGYGWFADVSAACVAHLAQECAEKQARLAAEAAERERKQAEENRLAERREREARLAAMTPEQQADATVAEWNDAQFRARVNAFIKTRGAPSDAEKAAIVRALRTSRAAVWSDLKQRGIKGEPAKIVDAVRALSKALGLGKMP